MARQRKPKEYPYVLLTEQDGKFWMQGGYETEALADEARKRWEEQDKRRGKPCGPYTVADRRTFPHPIH